MEEILGFRLKESLCIVGLHPVTLRDDTLVEIGAVIEALQKTDDQIVFCFPNADAGSRRLIRRARDFFFIWRDAHILINLQPEIYWSLLAHSRMLVGNSSSGIMETPALGLPTVNIGFRQQGRERSINIIDTPAQAGSIHSAMMRARSQAFRETLADMQNPYGDGHAGERIAQLLADAPPREILLHKRALPVSSDDSGRHAFEQISGGD